MCSQIRTLGSRPDILALLGSRPLGLRSSTCTLIRSGRAFQVLQLDCHFNTRGYSHRVRVDILLVRGASSRC